MVTKTTRSYEFVWQFLSVLSRIVSRLIEHVTWFLLVLPGATMANAGKGKKRRRLSAEEIGDMSPDNMRAALRAAVEELEAYDEAEESGDLVDGDGGGGRRGPGLGDGGANGTLELILRELRAMRAERDEDRTEVKKLREECCELRTIVAQQQRFMEQLDSRDRECNLIITGVPEQEAFEGAVNDLGKCRNIMAAVDSEGVAIEIARLGKPEEGRKRPILAKVASREVRDGILENTRALKDAGPSFRRIYVKKDLHPATRKEWKRLRDVVAAEKAKPVNQGCAITLDYKSRQVTRDGVVIDKWRPTYFQ